MFSNVNGNLSDGQFAHNGGGNMYSESLGNTNLRALMDVQDINTITSTANGLLASVTDLEKRARIIEYFYDKTLLDTIKLGSENNVYLKYCQTKEVPPGNAKLVVRRWGGLTEHTVPLAEGIPPKSDRMASESFTGTFCQYGRYMEFSDRVEFNLIDDVIAHYSAELGDVAVRTAERKCREEMIYFSGINYANAKTFDTLVVGDNVGFEDYRLQALKFERLLVKPINGSFIVICSPEHIYDLVNDPLVEKYLAYGQASGYTPYTTGKPVELFNIKFEQTMLDDYSYGYTEVSNPGEFTGVSVGGSIENKLRLVIVNTATGVRHYLNVTEGETNTVGTMVRTVADTYIKDGSLIPNKVTWDIEGWIDAVNGQSLADATKEDGTLEAVSFAKNSYVVCQLPVHRSFMFGAEHMIKTGISGRSGAKFYVKAKGSAGVLDPIDQRQSVGYKIDTLGFTCVRPEALQQFIFVPTKAIDTYMAVASDFAMHYNDGEYDGVTEGVYGMIKNASDELR